MAKVKTPNFKMTIGTLDFSGNEKLRATVTEIEVEQVSDGASSFKVLLDDGNDEFAATKLGQVREGDKCVIELGYQEKELGMKQVIEGIVTGVKSQRKEYSRKIFTVTGFDGLQALTRGRKRRSWEKIKDSDLAALVAGECGLGADVEDSGIVHPFVVQNNENNLSFLFERAKRIGYEVKVEGRNLVFKRPVLQDSGKTLRWSGINADANTLILQRCDFNTSTMNVVDKVVVRSYDPKTAKPIIGVSENVLGGSMAGKESAKSLVQRLPTSTTIQVSDQPVASQEEAEKLAESVMNQRANEFLTGQGACEGDPNVACGKTVNIKDIGEELDGVYYVTSATHSLKAGNGQGFGYWTKFTVGRSGR